ncbi:MAG: thermonuclease family protein [Candidatus Aenigmarchaeota archaeon]|nr:thermonuclease family protein [Candidatus Aenigmarchaeota archaeon]
MRISRPIKIISVILAISMLAFVIVEERILNKPMTDLENYIDNFCTSNSECIVSSCGCVNENSKWADMYCERPQYSPTMILDYTTSCECFENQCTRVKYPIENPPEKYCRGEAECFFGTVDRIIDGDTLVIDNKSIRLALVDAPEEGEEGFEQARDILEKYCPVGFRAVVDQDDGQLEGSFGRMVAGVRCRMIDYVNAFVVKEGPATLDNNFCNVSEFAEEEWTGCKKLAYDAINFFTIYRDRYVYRENMCDDCSNDSENSCDDIDVKYQLLVELPENYDNSRLQCFWRYNSNYNEERYPKEGLFVIQEAITNGGTISWFDVRYDVDVEITVCCGLVGQESDVYRCKTAKLKAEC